MAAGGVNDATYEAQKARIMALHKRWVRVLGFGVWQVSYEWHREAFSPAGTDDQTALFRIDPEWEYLRVQITVNLERVEDLEDRELEIYYLHEWGHAFIHVACSATEDSARARSIEHACSWLGQAFRWVRIAGEGDYKKRRKAKKRAEREAATPKRRRAPAERGG
jgi:hypothetical protein